jgi:uncharacterized protein (UPF0548 family)
VGHAFLVHRGRGHAGGREATSGLRGCLQPREADAPIEVGTTVAVLARHHGFRSLNACRIVYLIDEDDGDVRRCGFAYGTLPEHAERG